MDKIEAKKLLADKLDEYKKISYQSLRNLIDTEPITGELKGKTGEIYQFEIQIFWDDEKNGNLRVIGNIDDGGWRAFKPLSDDFIKNQKNRLIGE